MNNSTIRDQSKTIAQQAHMLRESFPELYEFLTQRDRYLRRILRRVPNPADPEAACAPIDIHRLIGQLNELPPGVRDLARDYDNEESGSIGHTVCRRN